MRPHIKPCPMCGKSNDSCERKIQEARNNEIRMIAFLAGRRSVYKFSRRENEIIDAFYDLGIRDFKKIADNFGISSSSVEKYYDRAMDKLMIMDFEI